MNVAMGIIGAYKLTDEEKAELLKRTKAKKYTGPAETPLSPTIISKRLSRMDHVPASAPSKLAQIEAAFEPFTNTSFGRKLKPVEEKPSKAKSSKAPKAKAVDVAELIAAIKAGKL